jgi:hypothetical protein
MSGRSTRDAKTLAAFSIVAHHPHHHLLFTTSSILVWSSLSVDTVV